MNKRSFLFFLLFLVHVSSGDKTLSWTLQETGLPYAPMTMYAGDTITFDFAKDEMDVYLHPSGTCNGTDAILVGAKGAHGANYTFNDGQIGTNITFACQYWNYCEMFGMIIDVQVLEPPPSSAPSDSPLDSTAALSTPGQVWSQQLHGAKAYRGNGLFLTPDGSQVVAIVNDGTVASYRATDGQIMWNYSPPVDNGSATFKVETFSGITFSTANSESSFMVYSVTYKDVGSAGNDYTLVVKYDMAGYLLSYSPGLQGVHSGSPVVSDDGKYVFLTHNSPDKTRGYFSILSDDLQHVVTRSNAGAFAPLGIYHSPEEGFFDIIPGVADGTLNSNDLILWSAMPEVENVALPVGRIYAFQFAIDFDVSDVDSLQFFTLGSDRAFQTFTPPVITNKGRSVYWSTSRSEYYCFIGNPGVIRARFDRTPNLRLQFKQNAQWGGQPIFSPPAVSTDENGGAVVFGASASNEIFRFTHAFGEGDEEKTLTSPSPIMVATKSLILASPVIDPFTRAVYYVESDGTLHQANYDTLADIWTDSIHDGVQGDMALNADGSILYVISVEGRISAIGVTKDAVTKAPSVTPAPTFRAVTSAPSDRPSLWTPESTTSPSQDVYEQPSTRVEESGAVDFGKTTIYGIFGGAVVLLLLCLVLCLFFFFRNQSDYRIEETGVQIKKRADGHIQVIKTTKYRGIAHSTVETIDFQDEEMANANGYFTKTSASNNPSAKQNNAMTPELTSVEPVSRDGIPLANAVAMPADAIAANQQQTNEELEKLIVSKL